eukprot:COSAG02_NODE_7792_length_2843_cov_2.179300_2_plen_165_part_00
MKRSVPWCRRPSLMSTATHLHTHRISAVWNAHASCGFCSCNLSKLRQSSLWTTVLGSTAWLVKYRSNACVAKRIRPPQKSCLPRTEVACLGLAAYHQAFASALAVLRVAAVCTVRCALSALDDLVARGRANFKRRRGCVGLAKAHSGHALMQHIDHEDYAADYH